MQHATPAIAIIGMGPRGLNVLERITAYACDQKTDKKIAVHLIDPGVPGEGIHHSSQPDYLQLNTVASQITLFMDPTVVDAGPLIQGPSLYEWAVGNWKHPLPLGPDTYLPRSAFGEYLNWVFKFLIDRLEQHCDVHLHTCTATDIEQTATHSFVIQMAHGKTINADYLFLTTGHSENHPDALDIDRRAFVATHRFNNANLRYVVTGPLPIHKQLDEIAPDASVAIEGMGLTAIDAITALTVGRGGRFKRDEATGVLNYQPSGAEPSLALFSRSGIPFAARAVNQKGVSGQYQARFLTLERINQWKQTHKPGELDFHGRIFPLILRDMAHAYYLSHATRLHGSSFAELLDTTLVHLDTPAAENVLRQCCPQIPRFSWDALANPISRNALASKEHFHQWLTDYLEQDLAEAREGNCESPIKAACDVLRDIRDNLRRVVDFGALSAASHKRFMNEFIPVMNRLAVGPPLQRTEEMLALMRAGYLMVSFGPGARAYMDSASYSFAIKSTSLPDREFRADVLIRARVPKSSPNQDKSPLLYRLLEKGLVRPFTNQGMEVSGIDVDEGLHIVPLSGKPLSNAWALGTICEGAKFYTYIVARPFVNSTALVDAGRSVGELFRQINAPQIVKKPAVYLIDSSATHNRERTLAYE
ncbi:hypothetical protein BK659_10405 [Pseudomonas brassicacearum]|uniref:FAD-dependent urate hydroxylase HpyO/Asp monooxygenase CreE-like FAD/NAD(P)-binding domain-containing protein n=1 Tax=Pseudomonas brassicacearum TaxID=930166 RepID=A0A423H815_9PSED|nr:FAD/NAD(P)-binding protein [Pseudomonas brassicacearum]RON09335.1 hypothetical protein BK659_10405 [Pseudomonas brassicacearum]